MVWCVVPNWLVQVSCRGLGGIDLPFRLHVPPGNTLKGLSSLITSLTASEHPVTQLFELDSGALIKSLDEIDLPVIACHTDPTIVHRPVLVTVPPLLGLGAAASSEERGVSGVDALEVVETLHGPMAVLRSDVVGRLLMEFRGYSEQQLVLLSKLVRPGSTVIDAGANWGSHTLAFSRLVGTNGAVHAFEPQPLLITGLRRSLLMNGLQNVQAHQVALGAANSNITVPLSDVRGEETYASTLSLRFGSFTHERAEGHVTAGLGQGQLVTYDPQDPNTAQLPLRTLDSYEFERDVSLIRLVVEGMEEEAMRGARRTITKHRPYLYIQQTQQANAAQAGSLVHLLTELLGYKLFYYYSPHVDFKTHTNHTKFSCITLDILGIPEEKAHLHSELISHLDSPLLQLRRLRQYIRCHQRDGTGTE